MEKKEGSALGDPVEGGASRSVPGVDRAAAAVASTVTVDAIAWEADPVKEVADMEAVAAGKSRRKKEKKRKRKGKAPIEHPKQAPAFAEYDSGDGSESAWTEEQELCGDVDVVLGLRENG